MTVSPPRPKGPPLNALRAFEAAGRLGGFMRAAEELSVTPGAISQHIKALEDWVSAPLFERRSQGVKLTTTGARLLPEFTEAFDRLGSAVRTLRNSVPQPVLSIATLPSVALLWLSPRLPAIRKALPQVKISVTAMESPPNLERELFDLSLFLIEPTGGPREILLDQDEILPVCAPEVAARLTRPEDLAGEVLLHDASWIGDWPLWAARTGHEIGRAEDGPRFSLYSLALEEARHGAGVLMGHRALVEPLLAAGALVAPFPESVATGKALVLDVADGIDGKVAWTVAKLLGTG